MYSDTTKEFLIFEILDDAIECKVITESDKYYFESKLNEIIDRYYENGLDNIDKIQGPSETNDVRYALYKHDEHGWCNICVQDFDFRDYNDYGFAMPSSDSDPEYDAFQIFVTRVAFIDEKYIPDYYELAEELMNIFVNHKKGLSEHIEESVMSDDIIYNMTRKEYYNSMQLSGSEINNPDDLVDDEFINHVNKLKDAMENMIEHFKSDKLSISLDNTTL